MENEKKLPERKPAKPKTEPILQFLIAEHSALQSARTSAAADVNSRLNVFLFAIVGAIIALAFIGHAGAGTSAVPTNANTTTTAAPIAAPIPGVSTAAAANANVQTSAAAATVNNTGQGFFWFGLVMFPALFFLGLTVFIRALQTAMEDVIYTRGQARIRNFYGGLAPEMRGHFVSPLHDDALSILKNASITRSRLQTVATPAGNVVVINSILAGAWLAVLLQFAFAPPAWLAAILGAFLFFVSLAGHLFYQNRRWEDFEANLDAPKFPSADAPL